MKTIFNYLVLVVCVVGFIPAGVHAEKGPGKNAASVVSTQSASSYCADIDSTKSKLLVSISEQEKNYKKLSGERAKELVEKRSSQNSTESNRRSLWGDNRNEHFKLLEAKATTSVEKKAIATFKLSVEKAVVDRNRAIDSANLAFRSAIDTTLKGRMQSFNTATSTFKIAVDAAASKAKAECVAKKSSDVARDIFRASLKTARTAFENNVKNLSQFTVDVATKTRNSALEKAQKDFLSAIDTALKDLKAVAPRI